MQGSLNEMMGALRAMCAEGLEVSALHAIHESEAGEREKGVLMGYALEALIKRAPHDINTISGAQRMLHIYESKPAIYRPHAIDIRRAIDGMAAAALMDAIEIHAAESKEGDGTSPRRCIEHAVRMSIELARLKPYSRADIAVDPIDRGPYGKHTSTTFRMLRNCSPTMNRVKHEVGYWIGLRHDTYKHEDPPDLSLYLELHAKPCSRWSDGLAKFMILLPEFRISEYWLDENDESTKGVEKKIEAIVKKHKKEYEHVG